MALASMTLDPNAASYSDDEIVGKVNTATAQITRASSVAAAARPLISAEVTVSIIAASAVGSVAMAAGLAKINLDAMTDITRGYVKTSPITGQFRVIALERQADGKLKTEYDDVAIT